MGHGGEGRHGESASHGGHDLMDEFASHRSHTTAAEDLARLRIGQQADEAVGLAHDEGFAVVIERVASDAVGDSGSLGGLLGEADRRQLGIGEHDVEQQSVVHGAWGGGMNDVVGGHFSLLDGDMDDFVGAGAVAGSEDVGGRGAHLRVGEDPAGLGPDAGRFEADPVGVGGASQGEQDVVGLDVVALALVFEGDGFARAISAGFEEASVGEDGHAFPAEDGFEDGCHGGIEVAQESGAALDEGDGDSEAVEALRQFDGDRAPAEDDEGLGQSGEGEGVVAGEATHVREGGQGGRGYGGAGGDDGVGGGEGTAVGQGQGMGVGEPGGGADEFEPSVVQLASTVVGELLDEGVFAGHGGGEVEVEVRALDAPGGGLAGLLEEFGGVEEGFGGHAAAQDTESAQFFGSIDHDRVQAGGGGGAGGGVAGAAAAEDGHVILVGVGACVHGGQDDLGDDG